jgi:hypothetical protein
MLVEVDGGDHDVSAQWSRTDPDVGSGFLVEESLGQRVGADIENSFASPRSARSSAL